ncbi:MAG: hypothetical protein E7656_07560 [Ruminococcaceae bacterium]|nr:hypothetical protein [Oscillospiraceae bacterium]
MEFVGKWVFHSIAARDDNFELIYLDAEEYIKSPMPYVDENNPDEVEDEIRERKRIAGTALEVCEDGKIYPLMAIPEEATKEDIDEAVKSGEFFLRCGMLWDGSSFDWEIRDGEPWYNTGIEGEVFGEKADPWQKALDENGLFDFMTTKFVKEA